LGREIVIREALIANLIVNLIANLIANPIANHQLRIINRKSSHPNHLIQILRHMPYQNPPTNGINNIIHIGVPEALRRFAVMTAMT